MGEERPVTTRGWISRTCEEIAPWGFFIVLARRQERRCRGKDLLKVGAYQQYTELSEADLERRLAEEHERADRLDDKTVKLTLSIAGGLSVLGLGLTMLGTTTSALEDAKAIAGSTNYLALAVAASVLHFLGASWMALGALRTQPRHGIGTQYLLALKGNDRRVTQADQLARQEIRNIIRQIRNEAVFQTVRNGMIVLGMAAVAAAFATLGSGESGAAWLGCSVRPQEPLP